ncbi:nickel pincer cofactor biosynthesis protein LarC [Nocardioides pantholopis]|uniref:nickel pincer cofactor biosynthesis protein LarC n=1 Tax=Nocardioides pantholopis TaxID=2483798 RepID=UPI000FD70B26|nr:nickel pincer cofactor biosynthesis protein LarC [Nocardioides pantholopis]
MSTTLWIDASAGASGDMLLGALVGAGVPLDVIASAVDAVAPEPVGLAAEEVRRAGLAATRCHVEVATSTTHRSWAEVRALLEAADLADEVRALALAVFGRLAAAEGAVHGRPADEVHFHEVGALDSIADVVGAAAGLVHLGAAQVVVSPVAVGSGSVRTAHGVLPVPPPAVAELLRGVPSYAGPAGAPAAELCTPTGAAVLTTVATGWGAQPPMTVTAVGSGAGARDPEGHPNVLRLLVGSAPGTADPAEQQVVLACNVDDLDPRVWPAVLEALLAAGAVDAWLTPIVMKKGRPAHTLAALVPLAALAAVRTAVFTHTSTIGVREHPVAKHALERSSATVTVAGQPVSVKLARLAGRVVNAQPEYDDVARAAATLGRPVADVLGQAQAEARALLGP